MALSKLLIITLLAATKAVTEFSSAYLMPLLSLLQKHDL
jgi:hypothetical protein